MSSSSRTDRLLTPKTISFITHEHEGTCRKKLAAGLYGPALAPGTVVRGWAIRASVFWAHIEALETEPAPRRIPPELKVDEDIRERLEGRTPKRRGQKATSPRRRSRMG